VICTTEAEGRVEGSALKPETAGIRNQRVTGVDEHRKTISMVLRYAHNYPESLCAGIEILDRAPAGMSTIGQICGGRGRREFVASD